MKVSKEALLGVIFVLLLVVGLLAYKYSHKIVKTHISGDKNSKEIIDSLNRVNKQKDSIIGLYNDSLKESRIRIDESIKRTKAIQRYYDKTYRSITVVPLRGKDSILRANIPGL